RHAGSGVAAAEVHSAAIVGRQISETVLGCHRDGEAVAGGRCGGGGGQHQRGRGGGVHRQVGGRCEVIGGVGRGQRLRPGLDQRGRKGALTVGQRRVGRQVYRGAGIAAAEVDGAGIARVGVSKGILRAHREGKARASRRCRG